MCFYFGKTKVSTPESNEQVKQRDGLFHDLSFVFIVPLLFKEADVFIGQIDQK
jgi:hypothetical protein